MPICLFTFCRAFVDARDLRKKRQSVVDQLGGFSQQGAVYNIMGRRHRPPVLLAICDVPAPLKNSFHAKIF